MKGTIMLHPIGTNVHDIHQYDRGIKVVFACKEHPQYEYASKEPGRSQWFPANEAARALQWGGKDECTHTLRDDVWFTTQPYEDDAKTFPVGTDVEILMGGEWVGPYTVTDGEGRSPEHLVLRGSKGVFEHHNDAPFNIRRAL
jgi:hypothetical protein